MLWADTCLGTFSGNRVTPEERYERTNPLAVPEEGDDIYLQIPARGGAYVSLDLTHLTKQELDYVETVIARTIKAARPIVERRDEIANNAGGDGDDDLYDRVYRQVPQLFVRERAE
jgi:hypothetical protein